MAKVYTQTVMVQLSKLAKGDQEIEAPLTEQMQAQLEEVVQEMVNDAAVIVEVSTSEYDGRDD